jgi:hypothetical protein
MGRIISKKTMIAKNITKRDPDAPLTMPISSGVAFIADFRNSNAIARKQQAIIKYSPQQNNL